MNISSEGGAGLDGAVSKEHSVLNRAKPMLRGSPQ